MAEVVAKEELDKLPRWARVAFVARCARHVQPLFVARWGASQEQIDAVEQAICVAERSADCAARPAAKTARYAAEAADEVAGEVDKTASRQAAEADHKAMNDPIYAASFDDAHFAAAVRARDIRAHKDPAMHAARAAAGAARAARDASSDVAHTCATAAARATVHSGAQADVRAAMRHDFDLLLNTAIAKEDRWTDNTPVRLQFFSLNSNFDIDQQIERSGIIDISPEINAKLVDYFRRYPERLYELPSRQFEELIAELFDGFGFAVELTKRTRDGGSDVIAISSKPIQAKLLIECKRYARKRTVGVGIVRALHGATMAAGANKGILATTGRISAPAREFMALPTTKWVLEARDFDGLVEWLDLYQKFQMGKIVGASV